MDLPGRQGGARGLQVAGRHAGGDHEEYGQWEVEGLLDHEVDPLEAEDVGELVGVGDHRGRAVGDHRPCELDRREHRALDVDVAFDEARSEVGPVQVDHPVSPVLADAHHDLVGNGHIGLMDVAGEYVHHAGVLEYEVGRLERLGHPDLVL